VIGAIASPLEGCSAIPRTLPAQADQGGLVARLTGQWPIGRAGIATDWRVKGNAPACSIRRPTCPSRFIEPRDAPEPRRLQISPLLEFEETHMLSLNLLAHHRHPVRIAEQ